MRKFLGLVLTLLVCFSFLVVPVYATETTEDTRIQISLPELPTFAFEDPYADNFVQHNMVLKIGSDYYAVLYSNASAQIKNEVKCVGNADAFSLEFGRAVRYVYTYQLVDGAWTLIYETSSATDAAVIEYTIYPDSPIVYTNWQDSYNADELLVYSDGGVELTFWYGFYSADGKKVMTPSTDVEFAPPSSDGGSSDTEDTNNSWSEEDKGWLGNLFDDLFAFFNNFYNNLKTKLENIASTITTSVGNFIDSAVSSVSTFINNAVSSIGEFIDSAILSISSFFDNLITGIGDIISAMFQEVVDEIKDYFDTQLNLIEKIINLIVNLWENFKSYTFEPVNEFLNGIDSKVINVWLDIFNLPMMSDILLISVIIGIFSGLMSFLKSR